MKFISKYFSIILWISLVIFDAIKANYSAAITAVVVVVLLFRLRQHEEEATELIESYKELTNKALDQLKAQQLTIEHNTRLMQKATEELKKLKTSMLNNFNSN
jgi:cell division protein FtsL